MIDSAKSSWRAGVRRWRPGNENWKEHQGDIDRGCLLHLLFREENIQGRFRADISRGKNKTHRNRFLKKNSSALFSSG